MALDIKWQDPPRRISNTRGRWFVTAKRLRERPGEWALCAETTKETASGYIGLSRQGCETRTVKVGKERHLYARFVAKAGNP